jgi:hypothetical protein
MTMKNALTLSFALGTCMLTPLVAHADDLGCDAPTVSITSPEPGATLHGDPAELTVVVSVTRGVALRRLFLTANGDEAASTTIDDNGTFDLTVELPAGAHVLQATADDDCGGSGHSEQVTITVDASEAQTAGNDGGGGNDGGSGNDDGGCAVSRTSNRTIIGLSAFMLAVVGAWRLRRGTQVG